MVPDTRLLFCAASLLNAAKQQKLTFAATEPTCDPSQGEQRQQRLLQGTLQVPTAAAAEPPHSGSNPETRKIPGADLGAAASPQQRCGPTVKGGEQHDERSLAEANGPSHVLNTPMVDKRQASGELQGDAIMLCPTLPYYRWLMLTPQWAAATLGMLAY